MPNCNECDTDTTGQNRVRGRCNSCNNNETRFNPTVRCVICSDGITYKYDSAKIKTKKGTSLTVCTDCWEETPHRKDSFPGNTLPLKKCTDCTNKIVKYGINTRCKTCRETKNMYICSCCRGDVKEVIIKNNRDICKRCVKAYYKTCPSCEIEVNIKQLEERQYNYEEEKKLCNSCYEKCRNEIKNYSYKPNPITFFPEWVDKEKADGVWSRGRKLLYLGIELEMECSSYPPMVALGARKLSKDRVFNKSDTSIRKGFEMVSHPMILSYHQKPETEDNKDHMNWEELFKFLTSKGCLSHNTTTCGLHIHANKSFLSEVALNKLDVFVNSHMQEISQIARRNKESHARYKKVKKEDFKGMGNKGRDALNLQLPNTVEFRMFKGTLKHSTFIASLQFVDACMRFITTISWIDLCNLEKSWKLFIAFVDNNKYTELQKYLKLRKVRKPYKAPPLGTVDSVINRVNSFNLKNFEDEEESTCV